jgi:hypothetical protein
MTRDGAGIRVKAASSGKANNDPDSLTFVEVIRGCGACSTDTQN